LRAITEAQAACLNSDNGTKINTAESKLQELWKEGLQTQELSVLNNAFITRSLDTDSMSARSRNPEQ